MKPKILMKREKKITGWQKKKRPEKEGQNEPCMAWYILLWDNLLCYRPVVHPPIRHPLCGTSSCGLTSYG